MISETLLISSSAASLTTLGSILLYYNIRELDVKHLKFVSLGIFFLGILAFTFFPQGMLTGSEYNDEMTIFAIIGAFFTLFGMIIITWNLQIHQSARVPRRYLALIFLVGISTGQIFTGTRVIWTDEGWMIQRPVIVRIFLFAGIGWILIEMLILFYRGVRDSSNKWNILSLSLPFGLIGSFILLAFRDDLPFSITFYQIPSAFGVILFCLAVIKSPNLLVIPNARIKFVIIADRNSGTSTLSFPLDYEEQSSLNSAAITGITMLMKEISGKEKLPPFLGYADYLINIYPENKYFLYSITDGEHPLLNGLIKMLAKKWSDILSKHQPFIPIPLKSEFARDVEQKLYMFLEN